MKTIVGSPIAIDMEIGNDGECVSASIHFNSNREPLFSFSQIHVLTYLSD